MAIFSLSLQMKTSLTRRYFLAHTARMSAVIPLAAFWGCGSGTASKSKSSNDSTDSDTSGNTSDSTTTLTSNSTIDASKWATGGTAVMASASYPDPFTASSTTCTATCQATAGPCYLVSTVPPTRLDISEGSDGLPVRLSFKLLNPDCTPLVGASVEIWHTNAEGVYSGETPNTNFCSGGDSTAIASNWFRGIQISDAAGRLDFNTCFPGWYVSRTIHIHVRVRVSDTDYLTTQFFFADAIDDGIVASAPLYKDRGTRDTTNATDTVVSAAAAPDYCFDVVQMSDGSMQASKILFVRKSTDDTICTIPAGTQSTAGGSAGATSGPTPGAHVAVKPPKENN